MQRCYAFAGLEIAVSMPEELAYDADKQLAPFRTETVQDPHRFRFSAVEELPPPEFPLISRQPAYCVYGDGETQLRYLGTEVNPSMRVTHRGKEHFVQLKRSCNSNGVTPKTVLNTLALEHLTAQNSGLVFHCAYIAYQGKAILFTAPSGTGKSTQANLWCELRGARIINGDRAVIRRDGDAILACGIPFAGSSSYCENETIPLGAIVYLGQAPQTTIRKLRGYEAFSKLWEGVSVNTWDKADMSSVSALVEYTAAKVPMYYLPCTPDESAVKALEGVL